MHNENLRDLHGNDKDEFVRNRLDIQIWATDINVNVYKLI